MSDVGLVQGKSAFSELCSACGCVFDPCTLVRYNCLRAVSVCGVAAWKWTHKNCSQLFQWLVHLAFEIVTCVVNEVKEAIFGKGSPPPPPPPPPPFFVSLTLLQANCPYTLGRITPPLSRRSVAFVTRG